MLGTDPAAQAEDVCNSLSELKPSIARVELWCLQIGKTPRQLRRCEMDGARDNRPFICERRTYFERDPTTTGRSTCAPENDNARVADCVQNYLAPAVTCLDRCPRRGIESPDTLGKCPAQGDG